MINKGRQFRFAPLPWMTKEESGKRIFIAIELPDRVKEMLAARSVQLARLAGDVKTVARDNLHITLHFLGQVERSALEEMQALLADVCRGRGALRMRIGTAGCFPGLRQPRIVFIRAVRASGPDPQALQKDIGAGLARTGLAVDTRPWEPHITIGRLRKAGPRACDAVRAFIASSSESGYEFEAGSIAVFSSVLKAEGPRYLLISRIPLT